MLKPKTDLKALLTNVSSWAELETRIANLSSVQDRGEVFEEFCKAFFLLLDPALGIEGRHEVINLPNA